MIFLTVGSQLPFDRLVRTIDEWASRQDKKVIAQIGLTKYRPNNLEYFQLLRPEEYEKLFTSSELVISHVGMGTIISSLQFSKPLLLMPRSADKGEHRNDHQFATAKQLGRHNHITIAYDETDMIAKLNLIIDNLEKINYSIKDSGVSQELIVKLKEFVATECVDRKEI